MLPDRLAGIEAQKETAPLFLQIKEALLADLRVYFAGEILLSPYGGGCVEAVEIIVAPVKPIYDPEKLNAFMDSLVPLIPRSAQDIARKFSKESDFQFGKLYFDETIGATRREIKVTTTMVDPEAMERAGVQIGERTEIQEELLRRRTWVRVYPDATVAQLVADYKRGLNDGTVEQTLLLDLVVHGLSAEQFNELKSRGSGLGKGYRKLISGRQ